MVTSGRPVFPLALVLGVQLLLNSCGIGREERPAFPVKALGYTLDTLGQWVGVCENISGADVLLLDGGR